MFLIECLDDHSDSIVEEKHVILDDDEQAIVDDEVYFYSNGKQYRGTIKMRSGRSPCFKSISVDSLNQCDAACMYYYLINLT